MKARVSPALLLLCAGTAIAQPASPDPVDLLMQSAQVWARENLDDRALAALRDVDQDRARELFGTLQNRFEGTYLYDLATSKQTAKSLVPLLQQFDSTQPYATWLNTRLDYLDAAEQLRHSMQPGPPKRGAPAQLPPPSHELQRSVWDKQLEKRPVPTRAKTYVPKLKPIFAAEKIPPQLVWLAEVESSFNPDAKSPAGAAGMFQLMKPTAKALGLSTWFPDERLNAEKSAHAAAKYLRHLHDRFGDWRLALAAYNAGEGRVSELLQKQKVKSYEAIASRLPAETQMYVPKVEATLRKREGVALAELKMPKG
ncbi:MAG: lytic transglycosylase domain-containing protein [Verrucomicrobia bacterium]|nr:lytic transglycosylase domain-containing protein [Verrucomicrobiota bacterium]